MGKVEVRVSDGVKLVWQREAEARGVSVSEFVRAAVERELGGDGLVAAGPPVVGAERPLPVTGFADAAKVRELRGLPGVTTAADLFAPVAPAAPVDAKPFGSSGKKSYKPDFRPGR